MQSAKTCPMLTDVSPILALDSPPARLPLPDDFPPLLGLNANGRVATLALDPFWNEGLSSPYWHDATDRLVHDRVSAIFNQMAQKPGTVHIAFPQKNPLRYSQHNNKATRHAYVLASNLARLFPDIEWVQCNDLVEEKRLSRSLRQDFGYSVSAQQSYALLDSKGTQSARDYFCPNGQPRYFLLADDTCEQGTTLMSLASLIMHHGGIVMGTYCEHGIGDGQSLIQQPSNPLLCDSFRECVRPFARPNGPIGRLPELAHTINRIWPSITGHQITECLQGIQESLLTPHGLALHTLSNGECGRMVKTWSDDLLALKHTRPRLSAHDKTQALIASLTRLQLRYKHGD